MVVLYVLIAFLVGGIIGIGGAALFLNSKISKLKSDSIRNEMLKQKSDEACSKMENLVNEQKRKIDEYTRLAEEIVELRAQLKKEQELKDAFTMQKQLMEAEFRRLAATVIEDNSKQFVNTNRNELDKVINPLKEKLSEFGDAVNKAYSSEARERFSLKEQIEKLVLSSRQISDDTKKLTNALKGKAKIQGDWGEHILETMLENCGLTKGREFDTQETLRDASGKVITTDDDKKMRPDVVVHYPDNTDIIIDAKTSLTAYMNYMEAEDELQRSNAIKEHLISVRNHVKELASKSYQDYAKSMDFVMMFIPNDSAYMLAMQSDPHLWMEAYEKRVMIVSPTHLVSVLKMVSVLWRKEDQNINTMKIVKVAGDVYVKLCSFCESMDKVGKGLDYAQKSFEEATKRLSTGKDNAIRKLEQLRVMGVDVKGKKIPQQYLEGNEVE